MKPHFSNNIFISHSAALSLCDCSSCLANSLFPSDIQQGLLEGAGLQPRQETSWKEGTERGGPESWASVTRITSDKDNYSPKGSSNKSHMSRSSPWAEGQASEQWP